MKTLREIDKIEIFLQQYSSYDVSRYNPGLETSVIEIH
jgi:hypothetical protein